MATAFPKDVTDFMLDWVYGKYMHTGRHNMVPDPKIIRKCMKITKDMGYDKALKGMQIYRGMFVKLPEKRIDPDRILQILDGRLRINERKNYDVESWTLDENVARIFASPRYHLGRKVSCVLRRRSVKNGTVVFNINNEQTRKHLIRNARKKFHMSAKHAHLIVYQGSGYKGKDDKEIVTTPQCGKYCNADDVVRYRFSVGRRELPIFGGEDGFVDWLTEIAGKFLLELDVKKTYRAVTTVLSRTK